MIYAAMYLLIMAGLAIGVYGVVDAIKGYNNGR
jgi:hypothetical protein